MEDAEALRLLVQWFLDPAARTALFRASTGGRDSVLSSSLKARLRLSLAACARQSTINAVRARLLTRGRLPTALVLECGHSPVSAAVLAQVSALAECLQGASQGIHELEIRGTSATQPVANCTAAQLMQSVVLPALPHITTLTLTHCPCSLPAPAQLSQLRKVSLSLPTQPADEPINDHQFASLLAFLSQITSLELHNCSAPAACSVFSQAETTHTLTHFTTDAPLTDELTRLLIDKAPALTDLSVGRLAIVTEEFENVQWGVERLRVTTLNRFPDSVAALPRAQVPNFEVSSPNSVTCTEDFLEEQVERTASWRYDFPSITVYNIYHTLPQLLNRLQLPAGTPVTFKGCPKSLSVAQGLAPALPALAEQYTFLVKFEEVPSTHASEWLQAVLALGAPVRELWVRTGEVRAAPRDAVWPWRRLVVERGGNHVDKDIVDFLRHMPRLSTYTEEGRPVVEYDEFLSLTSLTSTEYDVNWLQNFCTHAQWHGPGFQVGYSTLQTTLSALQSITFKDTDQHTVLDVRGVPITPETMAMLRQLPAWRGTLVLSDCRWRLPAAEYRQLASHIPHTYNVWVLDMKADTELYQCICEGAREYRASKGLPEISITAVDGATGSKVLTERRQAQAAQA